MINSKRLLISYKLLFGLLGFSAVVTELAVLAERGTLNPVNFFSYFTIQTNLLVIISLLLSAVALALNKHRQLDNWRSAVTVYILIVGIGFSLLLANLEDVTLTAVPWDNTVLHYIMPLAGLVDFLIDRPKRRNNFVHNLIWLIFPVAYVAYSLIRGTLIDWYPYPFLNPLTEGYDSVAITAAGLLLLSLGLIWCITRLSIAQKPPKAARQRR